MKELCYCPPSYGGSGLMSMVAMVPESFLLFVGPLSCGRFSAMNTFGGEGKKGYLYITDVDMSLGKVNSEISKAVDTVIGKYRPKVLILLLTCDILIAGIDENAVLRDLSKAHPDTIFQSFPVNHIATGTGHDPVEMMYVRITEMFDHSAKEDSVNFIGSSMPPGCNSDAVEILGKFGFKGNHPVKMESFEQFRSMGHARYNILTNADGLAAVEGAGVPYCTMYPTYSFDEIREQYSSLFKLIGKECDLAQYEKVAEDTIAEASGLLKGKTISLGSSVTRRTFGLARLMLENGFDITDIFVTGESYVKTAPFDEKDKAWVEKEHPEIRIHDAGDTSMSSEIGHCCKADVSIGFNAAYMTDSAMVINTTDNGQIGYWPIVHVMRKIIEACKDPKDMKGLMMSYGVSI